MKPVFVDPEIADAWARESGLIVDRTLAVPVDLLTVSNYAKSRGLTTPVIKHRIKQGMPIVDTHPRLINPKDADAWARERNLSLDGNPRPLHKIYPKSPPPGYVKYQDYADARGLSRSTVYGWLLKKKLSATHVQDLFVRPEGVDAWRIAQERRDGLMTAAEYALHAGRDRDAVYYALRHGMPHTDRFIDPEAADRWFKERRRQKNDTLRKAWERRLSDPIVRKEHSERVRKNLSEPETKRKLVESLKATLARQDIKLRMAEITRARWENMPESERRAIGEKIKAKASTEHARADKSARSKQKWEDPEYRKATVLAMSKPRGPYKISAERRTILSDSRSKSGAAFFVPKTMGR